MGKAVWHTDLDSLRERAAEDSAFLPYLIRLEMIRRQIEEECPEAVVWSVAYGRFLQLLDRGKSSQAAKPRDGIEILTVTTLKSLYKAHVLLGEKVFGPMFVEFGRLPNLHIWTEEELDAAVKSGNALLRNVAKEGVLLYGSSNATDHVEPGLS